MILYNTQISNAPLSRVLRIYPCVYHALHHPRNILPIHANMPVLVHMHLVGSASPLSVLLHSCISVNVNEYLKQRNEIASAFEFLVTSHQLHSALNSFSHLAL